MTCTIALLDFWTNYTLNIIWKEMVNETIINTQTGKTIDFSLFDSTQQTFNNITYFVPLIPQYDLLHKAIKAHNITCNFGDNIRDIRIQLNLHERDFKRMRAGIDPAHYSRTRAIIYGKKKTIFSIAINVVLHIHLSFIRLMQRARQRIINRVIITHLNFNATYYNHIIRQLQFAVII